MKPQRRRLLPLTQQSHLHPCTRSRSRSLLRCTRSGLKATAQHDYASFPDVAGSVKNLRIRRIFNPKAVGEYGFLARMVSAEGERERMTMEKKDGVEGDFQVVSRASGEEVLSEGCGAAMKEDSGSGGETLQSSVVERTPPDRDGVCEPGASQCSERADQGSMGAKGQARNSRLRLFWNSSSHCYRRLLPFLMDVTKNASSTLEILPCQNGPTKVDKITANSLSTPSSVCFPHEGTDALTKRQDAISQAKEHSIGILSPKHVSKDKNMILDDSIRMAAMASLPNECKDVSNKQFDTGVAQIHSQHLENENYLLGDPIRNGPHTEATSMDSYSLVADNSPGNQICEYDLLYKSKNILPISREPLSVEELAGCTDRNSDICHSSRCITQDHQLATSTVDIDVKPQSAVLRSGIVSPATCNAAVPVKSILKRQRRDCRGSCTCFDCTTFLFNAEKAFEFSKKQLLDAEDVSLGLMKELSCLRKMLVDSVVAMHDAESQAILQLNQVREICRRATRAEDLARRRLKEMESDLSAHCRTSNASHSRVTFAGAAAAKKMLPELGTNVNDNGG